MQQEQQDIFWMTQALSLAATAQSLGEVPVGAVVVCENKIISSGYNLRETLNLVTAHAEVIALESANLITKSWRTSTATLYVTLEPCLMCAGALYQTRIDRLVYGAKDPKGGAIDTLYQINRDERLNHSFTSRGGVLEKECSQLLKSFFKTKRKIKDQPKASPLL